MGQQGYADDKRGQEVILQPARDSSIRAICSNFMIVIMEELLGHYELGTMRTVFISFLWQHILIIVDFCLVRVKVVLLKVLLMLRAEITFKCLVLQFDHVECLRAYLCRTLLNVIPVDLIWHFNPVHLHMEELKESLL